MNKYVYDSSTIPNLDDLKTTGIYFIKRYKNGPADMNMVDNIHTDNCALFVMAPPENGTLTQILIPDDLDNIYKRYVSNSWKKIKFT